MLYRDLIREIRKVFELESKLKLIVHYESDETKRPLNGPDDFDLLVHFHFNLKQHFTIHLFIRKVSILISCTLLLKELQKL